MVTPKVSPMSEARSPFEPLQLDDGAAATDATRARSPFEPLQLHDDSAATDATNVTLQDDTKVMATPRVSPMSDARSPIEPSHLHDGTAADVTLQDDEKAMGTPKFFSMSNARSSFVDLPLHNGTAAPETYTSINLHESANNNLQIWRSRSRMRKLASLKGLDEEEQLREQLQDKRASLMEKKGKCDEKVREIRSTIQQSFNVFCVFQGVIINALFTAGSSSISTQGGNLCSLYAIPFSLSLIAYVYFVAEILFELVRIIQAKQDAHRLELGIKRIEDARIDYVRPPADQLFEVYAAADEEDRITSGISDSFTRARILFDGYARLILFLSTAFTAVVLVSCKLLLCR